MPVILSNRLQSYRNQTFRSTNELRLKSASQAIDFVKERGFVFFWPIKNILMPSLWVAAAGDRPVADGHDDPGHVTWGWKDDQLGKRVWYYTRLLRKRNTVVSLDTIPYFYALSPNFGSPEQDYLIEYDEGRMPLETKMVYEALLNEGPLDTIALRRAAHLTGPNSKTGFNRALESLQVNLRILPVAISQAGAWHYAFIYDLVHRHYPGLIDQARGISEYEARKTLLEMYFNSVGAAELQDAGKLFGWRPENLVHAVEKLKTAGKLIDEVEVEGKKGKYLALYPLVQE